MLGGIACFDSFALVLGKKSEAHEYDRSLVPKELAISWVKEVALNLLCVFNF